MLKKWREEIIQHKAQYFIYLLVLIISLSIFGIGLYRVNKAAEKTLQPTVVNMRKGPGITYDIDKQIEQGTHYHVMAENGDWLQILLTDDDSSGWVPKWLIDSKEFADSSSFIATVLDDTATLYTDNTENSDVAGQVEKNDKLQIVHQIDGWVQVQTSEGTGWIAQEAIEITPGELTHSTGPTDETLKLQENLKNSGQYTVIPTTEGANIRETAETGSAVIDKTSANDIFTYIGQEGAYYKVALEDGREGYLANWLAESNSQAMKEIAENVNDKDALNGKVIVIDPGHGGEDPGALSDVTQEKEVTLQTAKALKQALEDAGAEVHLTREADDTVSLADRPDMANDLQADAFISLHYDSQETVTSSGTTAYYYNDESLKLAQYIQPQMLEQLPLPSNGIRFGDFQVLRENDIPAVLLELGYMSNPSDVATFTQEEYHNNVAETVVDGLLVYFNYE